MTYSRKRPMMIALFALTVVWGLTWTGYYFARASRVMPQQLFAFVRSHKLEGRTPDERAETLNEYYTMIATMDSNERKGILFDAELGQWASQMTLEERVVQMRKFGPRFMMPQSPGGFGTAEHQPMIKLRNLYKVFGGRTAVEDLTLEVPRGEIFGLLGHNGAGKSTSIGMMLGQVWPTRGEVHVCGYDAIKQRGAALRKVGAIFETPVFYDYLSGWRNLEILSTYTAPTPRARIREVIEWVGLTGREMGKVKTYSHGMRARLALAQALLPAPELLILDEPSDGLDPEGIHEMRLTILRLHREMGLTILLSSHLLNEVEQLCTSIAVMNQGRKVFEGPMASIAQGQKWATLRVNDFAAATQFLRAERMIVDEREGNLIAPAPGTGLDEIVRRLVGQSISIYEVAPHEQSLEAFYLGLMHKGSGSAN